MTRKLILLAVTFFSLAVHAHAEKNFSIASDPPGARVELNGIYVGTTPLEHKMKDFFFNGPKYLWSDFLNVPIQLTVSKEGYVAKTIVITRGPLRWVNLNNTAEKIYYVITSKSIFVKLDTVGAFLGTNPLIVKSSDVKAAKSVGGESTVRLSTEEIIQKALPAVVTVKSSAGSGSGFFITDSGIVVTNKHVVEGSETVSVINGKGEAFKSESIFVHPTKDLALIKVTGADFPFLRMADPTSVDVGADAFAIGSPGLPGYSGLLPNTVTKGIVSAFRKSTEFGLLIQTDASINHGNSGGPLLNWKADVIGVNTLAFRADGATGINFAIFSSEVLQMLKEYFKFEPIYADDQVPTLDSLKNGETKISVDLTSEPSGSEVYVDGVFNSSTPSKVLLPIGEHTIKIVRPGFKDWERKIVVEAGSSKSINAILEKDTPANTAP